MGEFEVVGFLVLSFGLGAQHGLQFPLPAVIELHEVPESVGNSLEPTVQAECHIFEMLLFGGGLKLDLSHHVIELADLGADGVLQHLHLLVKLIALLVSECGVGVGGIREVVLLILRQYLLHLLDAVQYLL